MPTCLAFGCSNNSGNKDGKSFFKIPDPKKDPLLCSRWLHNIGNSKWTLKNFVATKDRVVCSDHFHMDCYERDLMFELLPQQGKAKRKLKSGSIPTIFTYKTFYKINMDGTTVSIKESASRKRSLSLDRTQVRYFSLHFDTVHYGFSVKHRSTITVNARISAHSRISAPLE